MTKKTGRAKVSPKSLTDLSLDAFASQFRSRGLPEFRAKQAFEWVYQHRASDYAEMTNLPKRLREELSAELPVFTTEVVTRQESADGTLKLLIRLDDGETVETVMIPEGNRRTVCVSSQVGCGMGCTFCASGILGLRRQLSTGEIVEQVLHVRRALPEGERVSNLVFMGMGEPLGNYRNLSRAITIFQAKWGCGIGKRHMTVSTVGMLHRTARLAREHPQVTLAISLHAPNDEIRSKVVPSLKHVTLPDLIAGAVEHFEATGRKPTFEYCLISGLNAEPEHAVELAQRLGDLNCYVNIIPLNPVEGIEMRAPSPREVGAFAETLREAGIEVAVRKRRGTDIDAACGQLKLKQES